MSIGKKFLFSTTYLCGFLLTSNSNALDYSFPKSLSETKPEGSYQIARMVFLPDAWDDLGMPHRPPIVNCSDYDETSCPTGWKCLECTTNGLQKRYKKDGCKSGYTLNEDGTDCVKSCSLSDCVDQISSKPDNSSYTTTSCTDCSGTKDIKTGWKCNSGYTKSGNTCTEACSLPDCVDKVSSKPDKSSYTTEACTDCSGTKTINTGWACDSGYHKNTNGTACEKDCAINNCSGFDLTSCPDHGKCKDCTKTAANCSTDGTKFKLEDCETGYVKSGNTCVKAENTCTGDVGDILYSDTSTSPNLIGNKTPIGVVFDTTRCLAIALEEKTFAWSSEVWGDNFIDIPSLENFTSLKVVLNDFNGKNNTKIVIGYSKATGKSYPAFEYVVNYSTKGTNAGDWYLPAVGELATMQLAATKLNTTLNKISGGITLGNYLWASSEYSSNSAWNQDMTYGTPTQAYKHNPLSVRPILQFIGNNDDGEDCSVYQSSPWVVNGSDVYSKCQALGMIPSSTTATCGGIEYNKCQVQPTDTNCPEGYKDCTTQMFGYSNNANHCDIRTVGSKKCVKIMDAEGLKNGCDPCYWCRQTYSCQVPSSDACEQYKKSPWVVNNQNVYTNCQEYGLVPSTTKATCDNVSYTKCGTECSSSDSGFDSNTKKCRKCTTYTNDVSKATDTCVSAGYSGLDNLARLDTEKGAYCLWCK